MTCKTQPISRLVDMLERDRVEAKTIVFTNGCFDILHAGHVRYLTRASELGDILVLGLNSDKSVRMIKGLRRPIIGEQERAEVLSALQCIDYITLFDAPDPFDLIQKIRPDILVKGADWAEEDIIGSDFVKSYGGRTARIDLAPGVSTSEIIRRIVERYSEKDAAAS